MEGCGGNERESESVGEKLYSTESERGKGRVEKEERITWRKKREPDEK